MKFNNRMDNTLKSYTSKGVNIEKIILSPSPVFTYSITRKKILSQEDIITDGFMMDNNVKCLSSYKDNISFFVETYNGLEWGMIDKINKSQSGIAVYPSDNPTRYRFCFIDLE